MKEILKSKCSKCVLFFLGLYCLIYIYASVMDYLVIKNPNAYLDCGIRAYNYFDFYDKRSNDFRVGDYPINQCTAGKFLKVRYLALTDYYSGYIYRALPLNLSEDEMYSPDINVDSLTITMIFRAPDGEKTAFCFYRPIPWVYSENFKGTKEEFIAEYAKNPEKLDKRECF